MKHECDLDLVESVTDIIVDGKKVGEDVKLKKTSATAKFCPDCGRRWFKLDNGTWRMENRADRRSGRRAMARVGRANIRQVIAYRAGVAAAQAEKRSWAAKRARAGWKAKMEARAA